MSEREGEFRPFPKGFLWATATASYQVEGAHRAGGRGESVWDHFAYTPGKVVNGDTGDVACDHFHRYREDVALMSELGFNAYRFSIAWPRVQPTGRGQVSAAGLDFYDRLVDELLAKGIRPFATLYHWDLPQTLEDAGGWPRRETAFAFRDYAEIVARRLGDRVKDWTTHNEPWCAAFLGYQLGVHAPGRTDFGAALQASHNLLLSHGLAVEPIRAASPGASVGIVLNIYPVHAASDSEADQAAQRRYDGYANRWFLDPIYRGEYPADMLELYGPLAPRTEPGDLKLISAPLDFLGENYYTRSVQAAAPGAGVLQTREVLPRGKGHDYTAMDWEVYPNGLYEVLTRLHREYAPKVLYVTENGAAYEDRVDADGEVRDDARLDYFRQHFVACHRAIESGVPLQGYFAWSMLDNFEWALGYTRRFGIVRVDFETQRRTLKSSAKFLREVALANGVVERD